MKIVKIIRQWHVYNAGEQAGFDDATAARLIQQGIAVAADAAPAQPESDATTAKKAPATTADKKAAAAAALPEGGAGNDSLQGAQG